MVAASGSNELLAAAVAETERWLRSPDHQQVMRFQLPREGDTSSVALMEVRSVMGGIPMLRWLTRQAAISTWTGCRQNGWSRCHPQW